MNVKKQYSCSHSILKLVSVKLPTHLTMTSADIQFNSSGNEGNFWLYFEIVYNLEISTAGQWLRNAFYTL